MRHLSGKEKKTLQSELPQGYEISKKDEIIEDNGILLKNKIKFLIIKEKKYFPHLKSINGEHYPKVFIDRGAIPFLLKGADMMRPGIVRIEGEFKKEDIILICDDEHKKNLGIGFAVETSEDMKIQEKGKSIKVFHYFNDEYY